MITGIDDSELKKLIADTSIAEQATAIYARKVVKSSSLGLEKEIKRRMPVDTGRARASWGHGKESIWQEEEGGLSITQGSNVDYIVFLNAGHSQQAPAGFIDRAVLLAEAEMLNALGLVDPLDYQIMRNNAGMLRSDAGD